VPDLIEFCKTHNLKMVTVAELIRYRMRTERYVHRLGESQLPTRHGEFRVIAYKNSAELTEKDITSSSDATCESHTALVFGDLSASDEPVLVRVQTHCLTGSVFGSTLCNCDATVDASLAAIAAAGRGALIYLHQTNRGFGIVNTAMQPRLSFHRSESNAEPAKDSQQRDSQRILRQVGLGGQILSDLGIRKIRLLTNQPSHVPALQGFGIEIVEHVPIALTPTLTR
jgi:3,4-dihydroxy 2-butanone 4-phosphate synthase/GTP cyclohydrolase II